MIKPHITLIAAIADNNVIGSNNDLPWYLPEDLRRFKALTTGKAVVMGKNTFDSIMKRLGKPLPNRTNIVLTRQTGIEFPEGVIVAHAIDEVLALHEPELMVIGGAQVYKQFIDQADAFHITHVHQAIDGDVYFPEVSWQDWKKTFEEPHDGYTFTDYERI